MNTKQFVVRIINPSTQPHIPKVMTLSPAQPIKKKNKYLSKIVNILLGSAIGVVAGVAIYLMLKMTGLSFGRLESSLIIGFPSTLGILASLAVF